MAEALLEVLLGNLITFVQKELAIFWGVHGEIERLSSTLSAIRAVLADAEIQQTTKHSLKDWIQKLTHAAYVLDDILDECSIRAEVSGSSLLHPQNLLFRFRIGKKLTEISERLDKIAEERHRYGLREESTPRRAEVREWRQTISLVTEPEVYGRDEDREKIVKFLLEHARSCDDLSIYPIVGTGGVGKTTLAQLVFNDERVSHSFDFRIWVCVSENFSIRKIMQSIIHSASRQNYKSLELDASNKINQQQIASKRCFIGLPEQNHNISELLQNQVRELLQNRKYLLVLDDVWDKIEEEWEKLKCVLQCGSKGSSILVTTRLANTASIMGTVRHPHDLSTLSEDDCWLLFKQRAFGLDGEESINHEAIGKQIVRKCSGLPLAAKALGCLLRFKTTEKEWLSIRDSELWNLTGDDHILPALQLSYFNLDLQLRRCFAFCAIFPKDQEILKEHVIHLWMANGFISSHEHSEVEDVGDAMWYELYQNSFFQDVKLDKWGNVRSFKMHDLIHDLALSVMKNECVVIDSKRFTGLPVNIHHISCLNFDQPLNMGIVKKVESLRTFFQLDLDFPITSFKFQRFRSLRAMRVRLLQLPSLEHMIHLRYLDLDCSSILSLPDSICYLRKLETLKLSYCGDLHHLPHHLTQLHNLRHLVIEDYSSLLALPPNIGKLTCLKTLSIFTVGSDTSHQIAELRNLQLRGNLHIGGLKNVQNQSEAREANLIGKKDLDHLYLSWGIGGSSQTTEVEQVLEGLQPHPNLKVLGIQGYEGGQLASWVTDISFLRLLTALVLHKCENCQQLPTLGKLTCLKWLYIEGMKHVQHIDDGNYDYVANKAFPSLEKLTLRRLPNLERMVKDEGVEIFPRLSQLIINGVPELIMPFIPSVEHLDVDGCNNDVVLMSISNYRKLKFLRLHDNRELISLPAEICRNMNHLKTLHIAMFVKLKALSTEHVSLHELEALGISHCTQLESLSLQGLSSLRTLEICFCSKLRSFSEGNGHLTSLEKLKILGCQNLGALPNDTNQLTALCELQIWGMHPNSKIPKGLERIPSLQSLCLNDFPDLTLLPDCLGDMTSLKELEIIACPKLRSLPSGFQRLTNLKKLVICSCPNLEKQCKKRGGEEWHKIQHIPQIQLGWPKGRRLMRHNLVSYPHYYPFDSDFNCIIKELS